MGRSVLEGAFPLLDKLMDEGELGLTQLADRCEIALSATIRTSTILAVPRRDRVLVAAASIVRAEDVARLRPGATVPAGMEFVSAPVRTPSSSVIGTVSAVLDSGRSATALREAVVHAARAISAALAS